MWCTHRPNSHCKFILIYKGGLIHKETWSAASFGWAEGLQTINPPIYRLTTAVSDIDQTNINRDIRDGNWLSNQKHKRTNSTKVLRKRSDISIYKSKRTKSKYKYQYLGICIWEEEREKVYLVGREPNSRPAPLKTRSHESSSLTFCSEMLNRVIWIFQETGFHTSNSLLTPGMSLL